MKRFFKKLAFATLALSVVLVSSCKVEDIRTTFTADNAVFTVEVSVYDAATGTDVTREATISTSAQGVSVSGNSLIITGNPAIEAQTIAVTATYKGVSVTENVQIYAVLAGGQAKMQKQIVIGSPVPAADAVAFINVCVIDEGTGEVVTSDCTLKSDPNYGIKDGVITITGNKDIKAHDVKVTATLGDREASCTVKVDNIPAGSEKSYLASIVLPAVKPEVDPAEATITVKVVDLNDGKDVTEEYTIGTSAGTVSGNVITIVGDKDIKAQTITVTAVNRTDGTELAPETVEIEEVPAGTKVNYVVTLQVPKVVPAQVQFVVNVFDQEAGVDITDDCAFDITGTGDLLVLKKDNVFTLIGNPDIKAGTVTVTVGKDGKEIASKQVEIEALAAGDVVVRTVSFTIGTPAPEPDPAVATINVQLFDLNTNAFVTDFELTSSKGEVEGNVVTITGDKDIEAQDVILNAIAADGRKADTLAVTLDAVPAGSTAEYDVMMFIPEHHPADSARAEIIMVIIDPVTGENITDKCTFTVSPDKFSCENGVITIVDSVKIEAQDIAVTATYNGKSFTFTISLGDIAVGESEIILATKIFPVIEPAKAIINVKLYDEASKSYVTDFKVEAKSSIDTVTPSVSGHVVTLTGKDDIAEQTITITATSTSPAAEVEGECKVEALAAGKTAEYNVTLKIKEKPEYKIVELKETTEETVGTFFSAHAIESHSFSHDPYTHSHDYSEVLIGHGTGHGTGNWLYNETEFMFSTTIDYLCQTGVKADWCTKSYESGISDDEKTIVDNFFGTYAVNTFKEEKATLNVKVSAFSMYTAYATKKYTITEYGVYRVAEGVSTLIGTFTVKSVSTSAQYTEAAVPGHESAYHYGHGHDDHGHGHGGSNAGGGIIWAE